MANLKIFSRNAVLSILNLAPLLLVAGCAADGQLGREGSPFWFSRTSAAEQSAYFGRICSGYGYVQGTPEMVQCIANETRDARNAARQRVRDINNTPIYQPSAPSTPIRPAVTTTNCRRSMGGFRCTSY